MKKKIAIKYSWDGVGEGRWEVALSGRVREDYLWIQFKWFLKWPGEVGGRNRFMIEVDKYGKGSWHSNRRIREDGDWDWIFLPSFIVARTGRVTILLKIEGRIQKEEDEL